MQNHAVYQEGAKMILFLRALGTEEQRIAYAVLEGMQLQKRLDEQRVNQAAQPRKAMMKAKE